MDTQTPNRMMRRHRTAHSSSPAMGRRRKKESSPTCAGALITPRTQQPVLTQDLPRVLPAPRTVTPTSAFGPSWEDFDQGVFAAANKTLRDNGRPPPRLSQNRSSLSYFEDNNDEEMPMDEMMDTLGKPRGSLTSPLTTTDVSNKRVNIGVTSNRSIKTVKVEPEESAFGRIIGALREDSASRPSNLTPEERLLWDSIQSVLNSRRKREASSRETELEKQLSETKIKASQLQQAHRHLSSTTAAKINQLEEDLREAQAALKSKEAEHQSEVRAIQRVLAEITTEREKETQELHEQVEELKTQVQALQNQDPSTAATFLDNANSDKAKDDEISDLKSTIRDLEAEKASSKREADKKDRRLLVLERELKAAKSDLKVLEESKQTPTDVGPLNRELETLKEELTSLRQANEKLKAELSEERKSSLPKRNSRSMTPPRPGTPNTDNESVSSALSVEEVESLQKSLSETTSSLENAKKIIASLESANGSMAVDLRAKLKAKEEELAAVQSESADRKRRLDSLATELRDLQKKQGDVELMEKQTKLQVIRQKVLMGQLEKSMSGLQSASVVHEVSTSTGEPDASNVDSISEILSDTMNAIRTSLAVTEQYIDEYDDASADGYNDGDSSEAGHHIDALMRKDSDLRNELDQKKVAIRRLEDALKKQSEEMKRLRSELDHKGNDENEKLRAEIQSLREQCSTNMEVLAKKERELSVLRSSLKVDDDDAGYISDDASEGDDDENDTVITSGQLSQLSNYGPAEAEAIATLLSSGGSMSLSGGSHEAQALKLELLKAVGEKEKAAKDLQAERESLANAKMIISSLEQANKSMMEDLRARLQDSNTAIASLLEKSLEHEKLSSTLQEELGKTKKEKEDLENQFKEEVKRLKDEAEISSVRIAAKERELSDLRKSVEVKVAPEEKKEELEEIKIEC